MLCKIIKINDKNVLAVVFVQNACYEGAALIFMILQSVISQERAIIF